MLSVLFAAEGDINPWLIIGVVAVLLFVVFILPTFTHKRQENQYKNMLDNIKVGYKVKTIGGVVGTVIDINISGSEKNFTIETGIGDNKSTLVFDVMAVYQVLEPKLTPEMLKKNESESNTLKPDEKTNAETITIQKSNQDTDVFNEEKQDIKADKEEAASTTLDSGAIIIETEHTEDEKSDNAEAPAKKPTSKKTTPKSTKKD